MSNLPDFADYKVKIDAEVARVAGEIAEREEQIRLLTEQNTAANERISNLNGVGVKVADALQALAMVEPVLNPLPAVIEKQKRTRPKLKQTLTSIFKESGALGMSESEMVALIKEQTQVDVNLGSLRSFLYTAQRDGVIQKREDRWYSRDAAAEQPAVQAAVQAA